MVFLILQKAFFTPNGQAIKLVNGASLLQAVPESLMN